MQLATATPAEARAEIRSRRWTGNTSGMCQGYVQANLVILPEALAQDFERACMANPQPLPLLDMTRPGDPHPSRVAPDADLRTDLPRYRVYRDGEVAAEPEDVTDLWRNDLVGFLLGCSFSAEARLLAAGVRLRHIELGRNVAMWRTNRDVTPAGAFHGPLVVSMRPIRRDQLDTAVRVTAELPIAHGAPVHAGDPEALGIGDLARPDYGEALLPEADEVPVFWACGVTPQAMLAASRIPFAITHAPGHMFVTDLRDSDTAGRSPGALTVP